MKATPLILAAILVAVALGMLVYGPGVVHLPSPETGIRDLAAALGTYAYVLVGVLALLETGAGLGFIVPGEIAVILGGVSAGQNEIQLPILIAVVWCCALAGDLGSFFLARRLGRRFMFAHGPRFGISHARIEQAERFFAAHGGKTIIVGRFIGFVRPLSPFIAGASNMAARRFIPCTTVAAGLWAVTFSVLGYVFSRSLDDLLALTGQGTAAVSAALVVAVAAVVLHRRLRGDGAELGDPDVPLRPPAPGPAGGD
jgi:membrane protein DedA with SNARE-associated domain